MVYLLSRRFEGSLNSLRTFLGKQCSCFIEIRDQNSLLSGFYPQKKIHLFFIHPNTTLYLFVIWANWNANQKLLGEVIGAAWPEWGSRALLNVLPVEASSITSQQALKSSVYGMFKSCVNMAFTPPFIFVMMLPNGTGSRGRAEQAARTRAHLPAAWLKRSQGEHQPPQWKATPLA